MPRAIDRDLFDLPEMSAPEEGPQLLHPVLQDFAPKIEQWILRALVQLGCLNGQSRKLRSLYRDLSDIVNVDPTLSDRRKISGALIDRHAQIAEESLQIEGSFMANLVTIANDLRLSETELELIAFATVYRQYPLLERVTDFILGHIDRSKLPFYLSKIFNHSLINCENAIKMESALVSTGLIELPRHARHRGRKFHELISLHPNLSNALLSKQFSLSDLLNMAIRRSEGTSLTVSDFDFMAHERDLVAAYLRAVKDKSGRNSSILLDGSPGVGKTHFARSIAQHCGFNVFEINEFDEELEAASINERLSFLLMAQRLMKNTSQNLIIFDEADAVLGSGVNLNRDRWQHSKASLNRILDTLTMPTIWITNQADCLDPAIGRRFDLTIRFRPMPAKTKKRLIQAAVPKGTVMPKWLNHVIHHENVTPARIEQAEHVSKLLAENEEDKQGDHFFSVLAQNIGVREPEFTEERPVNPFEFCSDFINASENMSALSQAISQVQEARLCLYGPPGTGKTAYARHLADQCELRLAEYRASDLLSAYVGQSEAQIRCMFAENDDSETLLFLDEADSLFRSRTLAKRNFEINQVNELLKGLEEFSGVFMASTNLLNELDPAVMRRFDFKVQLDYLKPDQSGQLFLELAKFFNIEIDDSAYESTKRALQRLNFLTPGDFAALARRGRVLPSVETCSELVELLQREMLTKPESRSAMGMGFTAELAA